MLSRVGIALVSDFPAVNAILEYQIERTAGEFLGAIRAAIGSASSLAPYAGSCKVLLELANGFEGEIAL